MENKGYGFRVDRERGITFTKGSSQKNFSGPLDVSEGKWNRVAPHVLDCPPMGRKVKVVWLGINPAIDRGKKKYKNIWEAPLSKVLTHSFDKCKEYGDDLYFKIDTAAMRLQEKLQEIILRENGTYVQVNLEEIEGDPCVRALAEVLLLNRQQWAQVTGKDTVWGENSVPFSWTLLNTIKDAWYADKLWNKKPWWESDKNIALAFRDRNRPIEGIEIFYDEVMRLELYPMRTDKASDLGIFSGDPELPSVRAVSSVLGALLAASESDSDFVIIGKRIEEWRQALGAWAEHSGSVEKEEIIKKFDGRLLQFSNPQGGWLSGNNVNRCGVREHAWDMLRNVQGVELC